MRIEDYFQQIRQILEGSPLISSFDVAYDKRSTHTGFIRGEIYFVNGSILHLREFVDVEIMVERLAYSYQYMGPSKTLVFRYDNTGHHKKLNLPTYPHHKHLQEGRGVIASAAPDLGIVINEIEASIQLP